MASKKQAGQSLLFIAISFTKKPREKRGTMEDTGGWLPTSQLPGPSRQKLQKGIETKEGWDRLVLEGWAFRLVCGCSNGLTRYDGKKVGYVKKPSGFE